MQNKGEEGHPPIKKVPGDKNNTIAPWARLVAMTIYP
jgi:hypothetical protein